MVINTTHLIITLIHAQILLRKEYCGIKERHFNKLI